MHTSTKEPLNDLEKDNQGLLPHYNKEAQEKIRRIILEDWKLSDAKLPTYMKQVARFIIPLGVSDDWLKKLSHQTMSKMLNRVSTPRYEFWACLHLYLNKKYGNIGLDGDTDDEIIKLGQFLRQFVSSNNESIAGSFRLDKSTVIKLVDKTDYQLIAMVRHTQPHEPFADMVYQPHEGAGLVNSDRINAVLRTTDKTALKTLHIPTDTLGELDNSNLKRKLAERTGDV